MTSTEATDRTFQVDLRGIVDLLSRHLYSGPRVFVRELLQNAVDALTVREQAGDMAHDAPAVLLIGSDVSADGRLHCADRGLGLDQADAESFLATIGRSSKRDTLGFARSDLLGQFGIGLLSCFLVSDEIEMVSRRAGGQVVRWRGRADGTWGVDVPEFADDDPRAAWLAEAGTWVSLTPRHDAEEWLTSDTVTRLARSYGRHLPHMIVCRTQRGDELVSAQPLPWLVEDRHRVRAMSGYAAEHLGFEPFAVIPLAVPQAGLTGMAAVFGHRVPAVRPPGSQVTIKGMLVGDGVGDLAPDWAFFARCAVDATGLTPTASREQLADDELLAEVRESIGEQLRAWLMRTASAAPARFHRFLEIHALAVKGMALVDEQLFSAVLPFLRFETNHGLLTLPELQATTDVIHVTATTHEFRQVAAVAAAQGVAVVNGGYVHDAELVARFAESEPDVTVRPIGPGDLESHVRVVPDDRLRAVRDALDRARETLDRLDVDVELRTFAPASVPALYLDDPETERRRQRREVAEASDDTWAAILDSLDDGAPTRPSLLLNDANPTVTRVLGLSDPELAQVAVESLYVRALLMGHHRLRAPDLAVLDRSFLTLLDRAVGGAHD